MERWQWVRCGHLLCHIWDISFPLVSLCSKISIYEGDVEDFLVTTPCRLPWHEVQGSWIWVDASFRWVTKLEINGISFEIPNVSSDVWKLKCYIHLKGMRRWAYRSIFSKLLNLVQSEITELYHHLWSNMPCHKEKENAILSSWKSKGYNFALFV